MTRQAEQRGELAQDSDSPAFSGSSIPKPFEHEPLAAPDAPQTAAQPAPPVGIRRPRWRNYTAFVLSGGGTRGALQVGALRALLERGERPDALIGTSIGAWNAFFLARKPNPEGIEDLIAAWKEVHPLRMLLGIETPGVYTPPTQAVAGMQVMAAVQRLASGQPSLYSNSGLQHFIQKNVGDATFEQMAVPLRVIAADITHGTRAIFRSGPIAPAVLASAAIPGVFPPVRIGSATYIDGGAVDNCSIETALALGARRLFVLDAGYDEGGAGSALWSEETPEKLNARGVTVHAMAAVMERATQVMSRYQLSRALERVPRGVEIHVIQPESSAPGGVLDFDHIKDWMDDSYTYTQRYLQTHEAHTGVSQRTASRMLLHTTRR